MQGHHELGGATDAPHGRKQHGEGVRIWFYDEVEETSKDEFTGAKVISATTTL
jgi:hypothetical protein